MNFNPAFLRIFFLLTGLFTGQLWAQTAAPWSTEGNAADSSDFIGTTNNQPLIFYVNNQEGMRLDPNRQLRIYSLGGFGQGFVKTDNNGLLSTTSFSNDSNQVLTGAGGFRSIYAMTGWNRTGGSIYTMNSVGIGISSPQYLLDVNGDVSFHGTVNAYGLNLVNSLEVDTLKSITMVDVGNNVTIRGGSVNELYAHTGNLMLQSHAGSNGNLILSAGTTGNVGVGMSSPVYKLDVNGTTRFTGDVHVHRLRPLPGDTVVIIGDSSVMFGWNNTLYPSGSGSFKGIGIGSFHAFALGLNSVAIGTRVTASTTAGNAIVIGSGIANSTALINSIPNSLMIGFNSNLPTLFIAPANGAGTTGKVGIGTSNPQADLQVTGRVIIGPDNINPSSPFNDNFTLLAVGGRIMCKDVVVSLADWPDYVFDTTYALMPMDSLQRYIHSNQHLPGTAPAVQQEQQGASLAETCRQQQQQIEELTLYILQLNERLKALESEQKSK